MKTNNRNERKKLILATLSYSISPYSAKEIHDLCSNISLSSICTSLKRYYTQGLIKRKKKENKFYYKITQKGIEKLEYLIGDTSIKSQIELFVREPIKKLLNGELEAEYNSIKETGKTIKEFIKESWKF